MITTSNDPSAIGVYDDLAKAERAIDELRRAGFKGDEIGIIGHVADGAVPTPPQMHAPEENAVLALARGGILGAIVGAFVILVVPGLGEVAGVGHWFDVLGGAVLGAAICGVVLAFGSFIFSRPGCASMSPNWRKATLLSPSRIRSGKKKPPWSFGVSGVFRIRALMFLKARQEAGPASCTRRDCS